MGRYENRTCSLCSLGPKCSGLKDAFGVPRVGLPWSSNCPLRSESAGRRATRQPCTSTRQRVQMFSRFRGNIGFNKSVRRRTHFASRSSDQRTTSSEPNPTPVGMDGNPLDPPTSWCGWKRTTNHLQVLLLSFQATTVYNNILTNLTGPSVAHCCSSLTTKKPLGDRPHLHSLTHSLEG